MSRFLLLLTACAILAGCGSTPAPVVPPTPLEPLDAAVDVQRQWRTVVGEGVDEHYLKLRPAMGEDTVYVADYRGLVRALRAADGQSLWEVQMRLPLSAGPSLGAGHLLLGTSQGEVLALDPQDGALRWRARVSSEVLAPPQGAGDTVVVRTVDGRLFGLEASSGERRWVYDREVPVLTLRGTSAPVISSGIVVVGLDNGKVAALTLRDGTLLWETTVAVSRGRSELERMVDIDADPIVLDDHVYVGAYQGRVAALQLDSGQFVWTRDVPTYTGLAADRQWLYVTDSDGRLWALDRSTGATIWRQEKLMHRAVSAPVLVGEYLVVGDYAGYLHWLGRQDGRLLGRARVESPWAVFRQVETPANRPAEARHNILASPAARDRMLVAVDRAGVLSAYRAEQR